MELFGGAVRVDSFKAGAAAYFLTHFHSDHMSGLTPGWRHGPLFCTTETAAMLKIGFWHEDDRATVIRVGETIRVCAAGVDFRVTAIDANHCPGACMFLFEHPGGKTLVTGDFRLDDRMRSVLPSLSGVDELFADVTYRDPSHDFPTQEKVIAQILDYVSRTLIEGRRDLVVIETYTIGKNKVLAGLYSAFGKPFYLDQKRLALYRAVGYGGIVTGDPSRTTFFACGSKGMDGPPKAVYPDWRKRASVIFPTGWSVTGGRFRGAVGFPYSEHCSYGELIEFLRAVRPRSIRLTEGGKVIGQSADGLLAAASRRADDSAATRGS